MNRSRFAILPALLALVVGACSERTGSPVDVGGGASLSFAPRFASFGSTSSSAPVNAIRVTARNVTTNAVVATLDTIVDPNAAEWEINLQVAPDAGSVRVLVELLNRTGASETVEWSGLTAPIDVQPGVSAPTQITLFKGPPANLSVTQVTATPDLQTLAEGTGGHVSAAVLPAGVVFWSSLDPAIATVDAAGNITTLRDGTARIVAEAGPRADTVRVNVTQVVASVAAAPDSVRLNSIGVETTIIADARDIRGGVIANAGITWSIVSGNNVVQDLGNGRFRAIGNGRAEVRAASAANTAIADNAIINVAQRGAHIDITPGSAALNAVGSTQQFSAAVHDANGNPMTAAVSWRIADAAVATIDANGLATARAAGSTQVIAVVNAGSPDSVVAQAALSVAQQIRTIIVTPGSVELDAIGATAQLSAEAHDAGGNIVANAQITWSISGAAASVSDAGLVTALTNGNATAIASAGGARGTAAITVQQRASNVTLAPAVDSVAAGESTTLAASVADGHGVPIEGAEIAWSSSNDEVATVDAHGVVTGHAAGAAVITASVDGASGTATVVVTGVVITNLTAVSITTTPTDPLVEGQPVQITLAIANNGTSASTPTTLRLSVIDAVTPNSVLRDSILPLPSIPAGVTAVVTQSFTLNSFAGLPDSVKIRLTVDALNSIAETNEIDNIAETGTKHLAFAEFVWNGSASTAWENPANWTPAALPHTRSTVRIPAGVPNYPVLSSNADIGALVQEAGSSLTIGSDYLLTVRSTLTNVNVIGGGTVDLSGAQVLGSTVSAYAVTPTGTPVTGQVPNLYVQRAVMLDGDFRATGSTQITLPGAVYVGAHTFRVDGNLRVMGVLDMTHSDARVVIGLATQFTGNTPLTGHLTAGELHALGDFAAGGTNGYPASGTHVTVFGNASPATAALTTDAGVYFNHVRIEKPNLFSFTTPVTAKGTIRVAEVTPEVLSTGDVTIGGNLELLGSTFWHVSSTTFTGDPVFPADMAYGVTFTGNARLRQHTSIGGVLIGDNGNLNLDGFNLNVGGTFYTSANGTIEMMQGETLDIGANASFDGGSTQGRLTHGRINFRGPFAAGPAGAFAADAVSEGGGVAVWFMGDDEQTISMQNAAAAGGNHFGDLVITNDDGISLLTDVVVTGRLEMDASAPLNGAGRTLTAFGDIIDNAPCGCENNLVAGTSAAAATPMTPAQTSVAMSEKNYHVSNTILAGSAQALPDLIDTNITVISNLTLSGIVYVNGNVAVTGNLRLGGPVSFDCPLTYLLVTGNFSTSGSGTLEMLCSHDAFLTLDVDGDATFDGGSLSGRLQNGRFEVGGNLTATASSATSFVSSGTTLWLAPYTDQPPQTIFLAHPLTQTLSDVLIRRAGQTGDMSIDFVNGAHVYGRFDVDSPSGAFIKLFTSNSGVLNVHGIDTCDDGCWYGMFQLYTARIDNLPIVVDHAALYIQYIVFGDYPIDVDQLTMIHVQETPYLGELEFLTVPANGHYHMRASGAGETIIVNNPLPATEADGARWLDENGAHIIWGQQPNLTVASVSAPPSVTIGQTILISGVIQNEGFNAAPAFGVRVRILDAATGLPVTNVPVLNLPVAGLPGEVSLPIGQNVTIAASPFIVWPAAIKAEILLDSTGTVSETNERDNLFITGPVTVNAPVTSVVGSAQRPATR